MQMVLWTPAGALDMDLFRAWIECHLDEDSIAQSILFGSSVFWFGSLSVPGACGRAPEVPRTQMDGLGGPSEGPRSPGAKKTINLKTHLFCKVDEEEVEIAQ
jgi:hypothetical protein